MSMDDTKRKNWTGSLRIGDTLRAKGTLDKQQPSIVEVRDILLDPEGRIEQITVSAIWGRIGIRGRTLSSILRRSIASMYSPVVLRTMEECAKILKVPTGELPELLSSEEIPILQTTRGALVEGDRIATLAEKLRPKIQKSRKGDPSPDQMELELHGEGSDWKAMAKAVVSTLGQIDDRLQRIEKGIEKQARTLSRLEANLPEYLTGRLLEDERFIRVIARASLLALDLGTAPKEDAEAFLAKVRTAISEEMTPATIAPDQGEGVQG
jgi:hypothetical protein